MLTVSPIRLQVYGHFKFVTFLSLLFQLLSSILHVGAYFVKELEKPRDLIFTSLAYPLGTGVVYTFWAIWHIVGRELIFPKAFDNFCPSWVNHITHTILAPMNLLIAVLVRHHYSYNGFMLTMAFVVSYLIFLHIIKAQTGHFVYKYMEAMNDTQRSFYFTGTCFLCYLLYKSGQLLTNMVHVRQTVDSDKSRVSMKQKHN